MTTIKTRIRQLYATAASLANSNPTLLEGEWGTESDTGKRKVGDGTTAWNSLPYWDPSTGSGSTNLSYNAATRVVSSDTGTDATLTLADGTNPGLLSSSDFTKLGGIASGATANATDAQLRDRSTHTGTQAAGTITGLATVATTGAYADLSGKPSLGTAAPLNVAASGDAAAGEVVKGNDSRLSDSRTPTAHTHPATAISDSTTAGRALLTAADAAAQRTSLGLGTAATTAATDYATAAQGTDSREWTAATVGQAEAEAGTATTRRAWTAERVRQAIAAWWLTASSTFGRTLANVADASAGRTALGLGTLATQSGTFSGTSSGTNTGDQTISLTGEVTGSGTGSFATTLTNSAVIGKVLTGYASGAGTVSATDTILQAIQKLNGNDATRATAGAIGSSGLTMSTARLLGRSTASTGAVEEIALGTNLSFSGTTLNAAGGTVPPAAQLMTAVFFT